jgi:hypothetical protein
LGGRRKLPFAFTEHGVTMLASVLRSNKAIQMNIIIVRAFLALRQMALTYQELMEKIKEMEKKYNRQFADIHEALDLLTGNREADKEWTNRERIGFKHARG